jgi:hypothetical protein
MTWSNASDFPNTSIRALVIGSIESKFFFLGLYRLHKPGPSTDKAFQLGLRETGN